MPDELSRRRLLQLGLALPLAVAACGDDDQPAGAPATSATPTSEPAALSATPACDDGDDPTPELTEGPYFTPDSPERRRLRESRVAGTPLVVTGLVLGTDCRPLGRALLDFWQADGEGEYDNEGYRLRGHQFTDAAGRFSLETVVPGLYPGRTRHIHVKVQPRGGEVLTTQLFFPGESGNAADGLYDPSLLMRTTGSSARPRGRFDFVLEV